MQRTLRRIRQHDEEIIKSHGLTLDFDEMARKGAMSPGEKSIAKWYGIYNSRQPGDHMARVVIPGGVLTSVETRALARLANKYARGWCRSPRGRAPNCTSFSWRSWATSSAKSNKPG